MTSTPPGPEVAAPVASRPFIVGLTGGIGSGKSTVADRLHELGATLVDADLIAHQVTGPAGVAMPALIAEFGADIAAPDGRLDRSAMRALAFADPGARQRLEAIVHPWVRRLSDQQVAQARGAYVVSVVPLLVESRDWRTRVDRLLVVDVPRELQIQRVIARSGLERVQIEAIIAAQASRETKLALADDVVDNSGAPADLDGPVQALHERYLTLAKAKRAAS